MREIVNPPQNIVDEHTLLAQYYAGYLVGHPYRNEQQTVVITVDHDLEWKEPAVVADGCLFCAKLTDETAIKRIAGYQWQLDMEATRGKVTHYSVWVQSDDPRIPSPVDYGWGSNAANLREFVELFQNDTSERRPDGWRTRPFPLVDLPLRLKRKLCVEWNHLLLNWMFDEDLDYDFETREFYRIVDKGKA